MTTGVIDYLICILTLTFHWSDDWPWLWPDGKFQWPDLDLITDRVMTLYRFSKMTAIASQIYFRFLVWPCLTFKKAQNYWRTKFRLDISIHGQDITTFGSSKQTAGISKFYLWVQFWPFHCHWHVVLHWPTKFYANRMIADGVMTSYWFLQKGGHSVVNLFPVSGLVTFETYYSPNDVIYRSSSQQAPPCAETRRLRHKA